MDTIAMNPGDGYKIIIGSPITMKIFEYARFLNSVEDKEYFDTNGNFIKTPRRRFVFILPFSLLLVYWQLFKSS